MCSIAKMTTIGLTIGNALKARYAHYPENRLPFSILIKFHACLQETGACNSLPKPGTPRKGKQVIEKFSSTTLTQQQILTLNKTNTSSEVG